MPRLGAILALVIVLATVEGATALATSGGPFPTSISPTPGQGADDWLVQVAGVGIAPGAVLSIPGAGVSVDSTSFVSSTQLTAVLDVRMDAPPGLRGATVTNPDGSSGTCESCFALNPGPNPTSVSPSHASRGKTLTVHVLGSNFVSPLKLSFGPGITVLSTRFVSSRRIDATIKTERSAAPGARNVTVLNQTDGGRGRCSACFKVTP